MYVACNVLSNCDEEVRELTRRRDKLSLLSSVFMGLLPVQLILSIVCWLAEYFCGYLPVVFVPVEEKKVRNDVIVCIPVEELWK